MSRRTPVERYAPIRGKKAYLAPRSNGARLHAGVDLAAPQGTAVVAPEDGVVRLAGDADTARAVGGWRWRGYGPEVVLFEGRSRWHVLGHLQALAVREGDELRSGDPIGEVSRLAHCHWEVLSAARPPRGRAVVEVSEDPIAWTTGGHSPYDGRAPAAPAGDLRTPAAHRPPANPIRAGEAPPAVEVPRGS